MRPIWLLVCAPLWAVAASAQTTGGSSGVLAGRVLDPAGRPIPQVVVSVIELRRGVATDDDGRFQLREVPRGAYHVSFQRLGYASEVRHVSLFAGSPPLEVVLRVSLVEVPGAQVSASAHPTTALTSPQPVTLLEGDALRLSQAPSLGQTVGKLPGVRNWSTGGGVGKPSIRGLRSDRVLIASDGQRLENQQWGDEHGPQVESADVERIEVLRGPASVLYGSDALGGVVNVIPRELPTAFGREAFARGRGHGAFGSSNDLWQGGVALEGAAGGFGARASVVGREGGDVRTPEGTLLNSGFRTTTASGAAGWRGAWGSVDASYAHRDERIEIHEDPAEDPGATPYQDIVDDFGSMKLILPAGRDARLTLRGSYEENDRREFEAADAAQVALGLLAKTTTADARLDHPTVGPLEGLVGGSWTHEAFEKFGDETLVPNSTADDFGLFLFEQAELGRFDLQAGLRYDHRSLDVEDDVDLGVVAQTRSWDAFSGNLGALARAGENVAVALNLGHGFRAPSSFDLFSNGVHEGTVSYEIGDPNLDVETSWNTDLSVRLQTASVRAEVSGFVNQVESFIHTRPTGVFDPASGFEIFQTVQGDARLWGFEVSGDAHPAARWHLLAGLDYVAGDNLETDRPLPWIPPFRATYGARFEPGPWGLLVDPYVGLDGESVAEQTRLDPLDTAVAGYSLVHLSAGFRLAFGERTVRLDAAARNLLDHAYRDFMSRYKAYALAPGRDVGLRLTLEF